MKKIILYAMLVLLAILSAGMAAVADYAMLPGDAVAEQGNIPGSPAPEGTSTAENAASGEYPAEEEPVLSPPGESGDFSYDILTPDGPDIEILDLALAVDRTNRISVRSNENEGNDDSSRPSNSGTGKYVAFESDATNLVSGDTNGVSDIFVRNRGAGLTTRVSVRSNGNQANGHSIRPSISSDGRFVAFDSDATNLVSGDTNGVTDVFVHDRKTKRTTRVSVASNGTQGDGISRNAVISGNGRYVAFESFAKNLVSGDTNNWIDVFVHDRQTKTTKRVSTRSDGTQGNGGSAMPSISSDGMYVAYQSHATNLVDGDTNGFYDIFVRDRHTGTTTRVSLKSDGTQANDDSYSASISSDGRYVAFRSEASNIVSGDTNGKSDIFYHSCESGGTRRISVKSDGTQANDVSYEPALSGNGRYVAFESDATNLVNSDTNGVRDIFLHQISTGKTIRVSVRTNGNQGNSFCYDPSITSNGGIVFFSSDSSNLVNNDDNGDRDVFAVTIG